MDISFLVDMFELNAGSEALVWRDTPFTYGELHRALKTWRDELAGRHIRPGAVVAVDGDFSPMSTALMLALIEADCIFVPLTKAVAEKRGEFIETAQCEELVTFDESDRASFDSPGRTADHELIATLRERRHPGLVLFSSGSTGKSKAAVHDFDCLLDKFRTPRRPHRMMSFLLYDHIGGVNTLLYALSNGGCLVTVQERSPEAVLAAVEKHRVELLPTSPTFINLVLMSRAYTRFDLSSLKTVTYGTEPMPETSLRRFHELFPGIKLHQTYGLSEVGILHSKSLSSDSLWVKVGGEGFETRVVDGVLQVKAKSAMLGYLNAASPFTPDGWLITGDLVEVRGEYVRFLGRESEIINVGGEKVYPAEVENVIQAMDSVAEVTVFREKNPIVGSIVCARVAPSEEENPRQLATRVKKHCLARLERFKVPVKVEVVRESLHSDRYKKKRSGTA